jgi:hypothetical protein
MEVWVGLAVSFGGGGAALLVDVQDGDEVIDETVIVGNHTA